MYNMMALNLWWMWSGVTVSYELAVQLHGIFWVIWWAESF